MADRSVYQQRLLTRSSNNQSAHLGQHSAGGGASLRGIPTCKLHRELLQREGIDAVFLGPEDKITKTVKGPAWLIVNRD